MSATDTWKALRAIPFSIRDCGNCLYEHDRENANNGNCRKCLRTYYDNEELWNKCNWEPQ